MIQQPRHMLLAGLLFAAGFLALPAAQAAIVDYDFTVDLDSGPLAGNPGDPFSGSFSFDDALPSPIDLASFMFDFVDGSGNPFSYGLGDAGATPTAVEDVFSTGTFVGIDYSFTGTGISFQFAPGFFDLSGATFSYEFPPGSSGNSGTGVLTITEAEPAPVPVPATPLLMLLGATGLLALRRRFGERTAARVAP